MESRGRIGLHTLCIVTSGVFDEKMVPGHEMRSKKTKMILMKIGFTVK
jgi:hypothetical protein